MANLRSSIKALERMSSYCERNTQSLIVMWDTLERVKVTMDKGSGTAMMDSARQEIVRATVELVRYQKELDRTASTVIPPAIPTETQAPLQIPMRPAASTPAEQPSWSPVSTPPVFLNSGAPRFVSEFQEADQVARQLYKSQQTISEQARRMVVTPPGMLNDMASIENRIQALHVRLQQFNNIPVDLRTEQTNNELEALRGKLNKVQGAQDNLSQAMSKMDIGEINNAYKQLDDSVGSAGKEIRNSLASQNQFNNAVKNGTGAASSLEGKIKNIAKSIAKSFSVQKIMAFSDDVTRTTARLDMMNDGAQSTDELNQKIFASAQRSRAPYMETAAAIANMGINAGSAFSSNDEIIAFMEQANKQFVIGGASAQDQASAMSQLTNAMAAGTMSGAELNTILNAAPGIARTIEQNMGWAEGSLRQYAERGEVSAQVVKASLLNMAQETNDKFNSMPATFGQIINTIQNSLLQTFWPVIQMIGNGAAYISENWSAIAPVFYGVAAGILFFAAANLIADLAAKGLMTTLLANPLTWIALIIGTVVYMIYKWVQSVGGIQIAWLICVNAVKTQLDKLKFMIAAAGVNIQNGLGDMLLGLNSFRIWVLNILDYLKVSGLLIMQEFINGAIDRINELISLVNSITGTSIELIGHVEFGTEAQLEAEARKSQRAASLAAQKEANLAAKKSRAQDLYRQEHEMSQSRLKREAEIESVKADMAAKAAGQDNTVGGYETDISGNTGRTAANTAAMADTMDVMDEELKYMRDAAEQEIINRFTLADLKVEVKNSNTLTKKADFSDMGQALAVFTNDFLSAAAEGGHI